MVSSTKHSSTRQSNQSPSAIVILAAGQGKRMRSSLPKVLHAVGGRPMLFHVLEAVKETAPNAPVAIVVGHAREVVEKTVRDAPEFKSMKIDFVLQAEQRGTGDALRCVLNSEWGKKRHEERAEVLVLPGDLPLMPSSLVTQMLAPLRRGEVLRLLTCELREPTGYGRVIRKGKQGDLVRIVEERDASLREKAIHEVAASIYLFQSAFLKYGIERLVPNNAQKELYLTDLVERASKTHKKMDGLLWPVAEDLRGVNDPWELAQAGRIMNERCLRKWSLQGVRFMDPATTFVECSAVLEEDTTIYPGVIIVGRTHVARGATIGPRVILTNVVVGRGANIKTGTVAENSIIGEEAQIGPYAHLRPDSEVGPRAKIGNFVELKKSRIGEKTSIAHLSYVGDADVGKNVNIGCGFVTCNFDGRVINGERKHKTVIEDEVFLGSDCQAVAPVRIGRGAYVASGSTITENVEADALAIARCRQVNKPGYARKLRAAAEKV